MTPATWRAAAMGMMILYVNGVRLGPGAGSRLARKRLAAPTARDGRAAGARSGIRRRNMSYRHAVSGVTYAFDGLADVMAKASPLRSGDVLAGVAASSAQQHVAAKMVLADTPLKAFLAEPLVPYETDDVTRLILDGHDMAAFAPVSALTVGEFRDWLLSPIATSETLADAAGLTPEMAAAVNKIMRNQDLILAASRSA